MKTIGQLIARDLSKKIEEIIKVDQVEEQAVHDEMDEYIVTDGIRDEYRKLLRAIAEGPEDPHENVGVWISGFFGSGKSSFAKNLGYILANPSVCGKPAAEIMKGRIKDQLCTDFIDSINKRIKTGVVMFDVQTDKTIGGAGSSSISRYMYRALLRELQYAEDFDIADLEQTLERDGKLDEFIERFEKSYGAWATRRKLAKRYNEASTILHEMEPKTFPSADSWALGKEGRRIEVSPGFLVERTFDLMKRRRSGHACVFIIDEVGAYVARNTERLEDLRRVVELFGKHSRTLLKAREVAAPTWVMVTSQEKLDDVLGALSGRRIELNKLQDRFHYRVDLAPADIREVATRRVLAKTEEGDKTLRALYEKLEGQIGRHLKLDSAKRDVPIDVDRFVETYPYPPYLLALSIDIMSGIRLQPGASRHLGGSNRTIIKQAYEMLASDRTRLADAEVGRLVTLDLIFELVRGNLPSERQKDISDIEERFEVGSFEARVGKAIALLELVSGVARSEHNLAVVLHDRIDSAPCLKEINEALTRLLEAQFVRQADDGYKLQTASEKQWQAERRDLDPKPRERTEALREALRELFGDSKLQRYQYKGRRQLRVGLTVEGHKVTDGDIPLVITPVEDAEALERVKDETRALTRQKPHENDVHWVFAVSGEVHDLVGELVRSRTMVQKYDQRRSQGKISGEQATCLSNEKTEQLRFTARLRDKLGEALEGGTSLVRGVSRDGSALGRARSEIFRALFDIVVPEVLFPKIDMGLCPLKGSEAEEILKASNLSGLPQVFYDGVDGLGLVTKQEGRHVPNVEAPIAKEVLGFLSHQASIGEKVSGKDLERRFTGLGYGWEAEVAQLALATLLRAGAIEVTYQGKRFRNHQDPMCREPFTKKHPFRGATFAPRESIDLKTLTTAAQYLEDMTGEEVDIEEAAIAEAFRTLAGEELELVVPARATARAHALPVEEALQEYERTLRLIGESASDDCVRILANEGRSFEEARRRVREVVQALDDQAIGAITRARQAVERLWPELAARSPELEEAARELETVLASADLLGQLARVRSLTEQLDIAYGELYSEAHRRRDDAYDAAIAAVRERPEWSALAPEVRDPVLKPLTDRQCASLERNQGAVVCVTCRAALSQMESELAAVDGLRGQVIDRLAALAAPDQPVERVRVAELVDGPVETPEAIDALVARLKERLLALLETGVRIVVE